VHQSPRIDRTFPPHGGPDARENLGILAQERASSRPCHPGTPLARRANQGVTMKIRFAAAALVLTTTALVTSAVADEALEGKATVEAKLDAKAGKVTIVVKPKGDGIYLNKEYGLKCTVKAKDGGKVDKSELKKDDATYDAVADKPGKAKSATLTVGADKGIEGDCKVAVCKEEACSNPFKVSFSSN
jgi:uncharacterized protein (DUF2141 family)